MGPSGPSIRMKRLGLAGRFAVLSAVAVTALGLVLARVESSQIRTRALANATNSTEVLAEVGLRSALAPSDMSSGIPPSELPALDRAFQAGVSQGRILRCFWNLSPSASQQCYTRLALRGRFTCCHPT